MPKKKKVPLRKCIVTKSMKPKDELIRIVRNRDGEVFVDPSGKKNGRGAYMSCDNKLIDEAKESHALEKQFGMKIDPLIYEQLSELVSGKKK